MDKNLNNIKQTTDIDRKLAIYYHPLFQEVIKNILLLFQIPDTQTFQIGLLEFIQFNLKLQKSLLPTFELQNALVSALNDWVKEVAECLSYEGMVSTSKCEQITSSNFKHLLQKELAQIHINMFAQRQQYLKALIKMGNHDAFKLLGVKINKQVFNKFMFDLCSTWCEFLDIELFSYFLIAIYIQISQGKIIEKSQFKATGKINTIDLQFMQEFEDIKAIYSKTRKKQLRYYRAWCQWNYLRINQVGQALILQLDQIHDHDPRILQLAHIFQKAIQVINDEITNQNVPKVQPSIQSFHPIQKQEKQGDFLIAKKIGVINTEQKEKNQIIQKQILYDNTEQEQQQITPNNFQIQIDSEGNMYLKKIVKLPILGIKIYPQPHQQKELAKFTYLQMKKEQIRKVSNLYKRMQNMKVRLEHNIKNDPYAFKQIQKIKQRDQFYNSQQQKLKNIKNQYTNMPLDKIIHGKIQPASEDMNPIQSSKDQYKKLFKQELMQDKEPIRKNQEYIHKVIAPSFLTDEKNNIGYSKGQGHIYGVGPFSQKRDLKMGLPKIKHIDNKIKQIQSYHIIGKITKDRSLINEKLKSYSSNQPPVDRIQKERQEYRHVWTKYISQQQMKQLNNYGQFYSKLEYAKKIFSKDHQSQYRVNLKQILLYDNKRYEMGGIINKKQEQQFYERIRKLIKRDDRRKMKKKRKTRLRQYRRAVGGKPNKQLYENIFINFHRKAIKSIKEERQNISIGK